MVDGAVVSFRILDLHAPDVASLLRIAVPPRPEHITSERVQEVVEARHVSDECLDDVLNSLRSVDLRFLENATRANGAIDGIPCARTQSSDLVRIFEGIDEGIFSSLVASTNSNGGDDVDPNGRGADGPGNADDADNAGNASKRPYVHVKINSPIAVEKKKRRRASGARVRIRSLGSQAPTAEEEMKESLGVLVALFESFNAAFGDVYLSDTRQVLKDVQALTTAICGMRSTAFVRKLPRGLLFSVMQNLGQIVRRGVDVKLYSTTLEGEERCLRAESAMEAVVLTERLILKANGALSRDLVIPEETLNLCVGATRFHLHNNVLPFYCSRIESAVRPDLHDEAPGGLGGLGDSAEKEGGDEGKKDDKQSEASRKGHSKRSSQSKNANSKHTLTTKKSGEGGREGDGRHRKGTTGRLPSLVGRLKDRILAALDVMSEIVSAIPIQASTLTPMVRTATQALTVEQGLGDVHAKCVAVLSSIHAACEDLRPSILPDVFGALAPYLGVGKRYKRDVALVVGAGSLTDVGTLSALVLDMVQTCAEMATVVSLQEVQALYSRCMATADRFWQLCMERLGSAKTMRNETDADFTCVMTGIIQDLLNVSDSMYWTCGSTILIRLVSHLNGPAGLGHADSAIRQVCVDVCGRILAYLHRDSVLLNESSELLQGILDDTERHDKIAEAAPYLILENLLGERSIGFDGNDSSTSTSSARFVLLRKISKDLVKLEAVHEEDERLRGEAAELLRAAQDELSGRRGGIRAFGISDSPGAPGTAGTAGTAGTSGKTRPASATGEPDPSQPRMRLGRDSVALSEEELSLLMKSMIHEEFLSAAPMMLAWVVEILESKQQSSSTRSKAVKALGDIVAVDKRLLDAPSLLAAIEHALQDDSISVRESALVLVGKHMVQEPALAIRLIHIVIRASEDAGTSVRKSAIKILRDCCLIMPEERSDKIIESYRAILNRSSDSEESVKSFVLKTFRSLWFDAVPEGDDILVQRSPRDRSKSLAKLATAIVGSVSSGSGCRALIDSSHPLIAVLREIRDVDQQGTAAALLDLFIYGDRGLSGAKRGAARADDGSGARSEHNSGGPPANMDGARGLSYLHAIYAMAAANPASCIPEHDPLKFLRTLAPHVRDDPQAESQTKQEARESAEETLYVLGITSVILNSMEQRTTITVNLATDISEELPNIINKHKFTAVVSAACACLSSCALSSPTATGRLLNVATQYLAFLDKPAAYAKNLPRFIFIVGQVYRYASRLMQQVDAFLPDQPALAEKLAPGSCVDTLNGFWATNDLAGSAAGFSVSSPGLQAQIRRSTLEAICQIMIASPRSHVDGKSVAQQALARALSPESPPSMSLVALNGLIELIQADASELRQRQSRDAATGAVAAENGEGDVSQSSAILQLHWDPILALAMHADAHQKDVEDQTAAMIRRKILFLIEISIRDGLCGPWSCLSTLVLFAMTDSFAGSGLSEAGVGSLCSRSVKQLKLLVIKYPDFVDMGRIITGIKDSCPAAPRHRNSRQKEQAESRSKVYQQRVKKLYSEIVCSTRAKRNEFLRLLVRAFKGGKGSDLSFANVNMCCWLAILLAGVPYKKAEEVCLVLHEIDAIASSKTSSTVADLHDLLDVEQSLIEDGTVGGIKREGKGKKNDPRGGFAAAGDPARDPDSGRRARCAVITRAIALCVISRLKVYLMRAYNISLERQALYASDGSRSTEKEAVSFSAKAAGHAVANLYGVYGVSSLNPKALLEELDDDSHLMVD